MLERMNDDPHANLEEALAKAVGKSAELSAGQKVKIEVDPAPRPSQLGGPDHFMSQREESMSMASYQSSMYQPAMIGGERMTEANIQAIPVVMEGQVHKWGGGAFNMQK